MEEDLEAVVEAAFESVAFAVVDKDVACVNLANQDNHNIKLILESFCCKKSPNQEIGLGRFWEQGTSEGSE